MLTKLADVAHAERDSSLQWASERRIIGPAGIGRQRRVLPTVGDRDVARIARIAERVEGDPVGPAIARGLAERHRLHRFMISRSSEFTLERFEGPTALNEKK